MESVGRLAGGIAHDFNNLLTVIKGCLDVALMAIGPDDGVRTDLAEIGRAADSAADLTRQLLEAMGMLELFDQHKLAAVLKGSDVRGILAGHLHYSTHSTFAGIPVSVASATCYTLDLSAEDRLLSGVDFGQSVNVVHVYEEQLVHSIIPVGDTAEVSGFPAGAWAQIEAMTPEERIETFSNKASAFNSAEVASNG